MKRAQSRDGERSVSLEPQAGPRPVMYPMNGPVSLQLDGRGEEDSVYRRALAARKAGFAGIDWTCSVRSAEEGACRGSDPFDELARGVGMPVSMVSLRVGEATLEQALNEIRAWLASAGGRKFHSLSVSLPSVSHGNRDGSLSSYQQGINFGFRLLCEAQREAQGAGVYLALEAPTEDCFLSPVEMRELIDGVHSWSVGVCVHALRLTKGGALLDWLRTLGRRVVAVRIGASCGGIAGALSDWRKMQPHEIAVSVSHDTPESQWDTLIQRLE